MDWVYSHEIEGRYGETSRHESGIREHQAEGRNLLMDGQIIYIRPPTQFCFPFELIGYRLMRIERENQSTRDGERKERGEKERREKSRRERERAFDRMKKEKELSRKEERQDVDRSRKK